MCPHFIRIFSQQHATTNLTFIGTKFHWPCFFFRTSPPLLCFVCSLCNFQLIKLSSMLTFPSKSTLQSKIIRYARPRDRVLPSNRTDPWKKCSWRSHGQAIPLGNCPAELLQARGQVWRTTLLFFPLQMRAALPALCFLLGTEACYVFCITPRALHVCHVFRTSLMKRRKEDSHFWFNYLAF